MDIVIYFFAGLFILMACGLMFAFHRTRRSGLIVMGLTYGATAGLALALMHWWPLVAGFVLVWVMRVLGLESGDESQER